MLSSATAMTQERKMLRSTLDISRTLFRSVLMTITVVLLHYATLPWPTSSIVGLTVVMELSISHYRKALELRHAGHPDRSGTLLHLANVLLYR